jgi:curli biogenesis system outer membrane secretion channel CsgG
VAFSPLAIAGPVLAAPAAKAPYMGPKKTVSIDVVGAPEAMGGATTNEALIAMFTEALSQDGRFIVVERPALANLQGEQQLTQNSATTRETGARPGQMLGASVLIRATVTKFEPNAGGAGLQIGGLPSFGGFSPGGGFKGQYALVQISLRMIDTSTGQVITTTKAEGRASSTQATIGVTDTRTGANIATNSFKTTPLGKAAETAIEDAVGKIGQGMQAVPWSAQIVDSDNGQVYVNFGLDQNIGAGTVLHVYRKTKELTDPTTGAVLDVLMDDVGTIQIQQVRDKVSTATVVSGQGVVRGDIVKMQ